MEEKKEAAQVFAGGSHLLILTPKGTLYGLLDNTHGAICKGGEQHYEAPFLMAKQVVSAAASAHCTIYVTDDGQLHLLGPDKITGDFRDFHGAVKVWASLLRDTFWIRDTQGKLYCFGENGPGGSLFPWEKTLVEQLPEEHCVVTYNWGQADIQTQTNALEDRLKQSEAFLHRQKELGRMNTRMELESAGCKVLEGKQKFHPARKEEHTFLPKIYYLNNYYEKPVLYRDQGFAETPHREGCAPLSKELSQKIIMHANVRKAVHIRGFEKFLLLLNDGRTMLVDHRGNLLWENVFPEPVADLSWGFSHMIVSFRSGTLAMAHAHTNLLRNRTAITLPPEQDEDEASTAQPTRVFGGGAHLLILEKGILYGLGSNKNHQISNDETDDRNPHRIAANVVSAAASRSHTIYVTADGNVKILGSGAITDRFPGFHNAKAVYAAQDKDRFYIVDQQDHVFAFGDNSDSFIEPADRRFLLDFTDEMILDAFEHCRHYYDKETYVQNRSWEERHYWEQVLIRSDAYLAAAEEYGSDNLSLRYVDLYHPSHVSLPCKSFRRGFVSPALYVASHYVYKPTPLAPDQAKLVADPLPFYQGCEPYELLPQGYEAADMHRAMPDIIKVIFNKRLDGLALRKCKEIAVNNAWAGGMYAPYPELPEVCDIALDGVEMCLIAFENREFYYGSIEALKAYSPRKQKVIPLRVIENGKFRCTNWDSLLF